MKPNETLTIKFPALCAGPPSASRRRLPALGNSWAARYRDFHDFPELKLITIETGTLVFTKATFDLGSCPGMRIYLIPELLSAVQRSMEWLDTDELQVAFENNLCRSCWGILAVLIDRRQPVTISSLRVHIETLLPCWPILDQLKYVDTPGEPTSFTNVVKARFVGLTAMWFCQSTGDLGRDLMGALEMLEANAQTRLIVTADWLTQIVATNKRIRHKKALTDPNFVREKLITLESSEREAIEIGTNSAALTFLYELDCEINQ
jgi:hypothetical protein